MIAKGEGNREGRTGSLGLADANYYIYRTEKAMTPYSSTLAWKIPWMEKPGRLQSMGSIRVGND